MIILGITTSDEQCGVALRRHGVTIGSDTFAGARSCVEELIPRIDKLLAGHGLSLDDVDRFGVDAGPGGLAGIKIGVSAVKTLSQVTGRPAAAVSSLYAMSLRAARSDAGAGAGLFLPIVNCAKVEFFCALYRRLPGGGAELAAEERLAAAEGLRGMLLGVGGGDVLVLALGNAAGRMRGLIEEVLGARAAFAPPELGRPSAEIVCEIAETAEAKPYYEAQPNYLCLTNAERNIGVRA
jgi:tRNA threonylcarbamoyl adenosine modification protein YeaZ